MAEPPQIAVPKPIKIINMVHLETPGQIGRQKAIRSVNQVIQREEILSQKPITIDIENPKR